ncbi:MAG: hypothetical protein RL095_2401 [Verrucomicrobiota bacterium]|jgi:quinoprotein glucose dehydrogenase
MRLNITAALILAALSSRADPSVAGLDTKQVTKPGTTKSIGALCVDSKGRVITNEVNRIGTAITDDRWHPQWLPDDLLNDSVEDRLKMYEKYEMGFPRKLWTEKADTVRVLVDKNGIYEEVGVLGNFNDPLDGPGIGTLERDGHYFYTCIPNLWRIDDVNYDGVPEKRTSLSYGWGIAVGFFGHDLHSPIWGPDGKIYFSIGDRGYNVVTQEGKRLFNRSRGAVLRINPDGSQLEEVCTGLRNPQEIAFNDTFDLVTGDNNGNIGDNARAYYIVEGGDYGWTEGWQALTSFGQQIFGDERVTPAWLSEELFQTPRAQHPWWLVPASGLVTSGPSGLVYVSTDSLGAETKGSFLICDFVGGAGGSGVRRFTMVPEGAGYVMKGGEMWLKNCNTADLTLDHYGNLLVGDFGEGWISSKSGGIWKVEAKNPQHQSANLFKKGFRNLSLDELMSELSSHDIQIRVEAQAELVRRGATSQLLKIAQGEGSDGHQLYGRLHALRGLGQLDAVKELRQFIKDPHAEIRTQALRALADARSSASDDFITSLNDSAIRVRQAAALGCARKPGKGSSAALIQRFKSSDVKDPWMRPSLAHALARQDDYLSFKSELTDANARRLYVVALRKARSPEVAAFLHDSDPEIVAEAISAISFENIEAALPALAEFSISPACFKLSELNQARALNCNLRLNNVAGATRLLDVLANKDAPQSARYMAGLLLRGFIKPWPMDFVEGEKLDWDSGQAPRKEDATAVISSRLGSIIQAADGQALSAAIKLADLGKISLDPTTLRRLVLNPSVPEGIRIQSLDSLADNLPMEDLLTLTRDPVTALRIAALKKLISRNPNEALPLLIAGRSAKDLNERQAAWQGLGLISAPASINALKEGLVQITTGSHAEVALDIYLAAKKHPGLLTEVTALENKFSSEPSVVWVLAAQGGNAKRGELIFNNPPSSCACLNCHKVGAKGASEAGPNLRNFLRHIKVDDRNIYTLNSLVSPTADLARNFGLVALTLNNDSKIVGVPLSEDDMIIKVKSDKEQSIQKNEIKSRQNISPMPPLRPLLDQGLMKPEDLRDLTEYLKEIGCTSDGNKH